MAKEVDEYFTRMVDLIPPSIWGFDTDANKRILLYKCSKVDANLTNKEKNKISPKDKSCYARCSNVVADRISEILEILRIKEEGKLVPKKSDNIEVPKKGEIKEDKEPAKKQKQRKKLSAKEKAKIKKEKKEKALRNEKRKGDTVEEEEPSAKKSKVEEDKDENEEEVENGTKKPDLKAKLSFSKVKGVTDKGEKKLTKAEKKDTFKGRDYKALLKKAEKREQRITQIREKNPEKAEKIEENIKWKTALKRAEGEKVKDNPELLKAASKRKEAIKEARAKKWEERKKIVEDNKIKKQNRREENIKKRRQEKEDKKISKSKKKGRVILPKKN
uniref:Surfeit locus protein 6 (inferred by orthology to a human protein) n=1 Tax=Strongyloides venezuelensis TaxID=75913 RepID=A0A0K0FJW6_STRVS